VVKKIMPYFQNTFKAKFVLVGKNIALVGFSNANWFVDVNIRRSTTSHVFKLGDDAILWNFNKQPATALENMAITQCAKDTTLLRQFIINVEFEQEKSKFIMFNI